MHPLSTPPRPFLRLHLRSSLPSAKGTEREISNHHHPRCIESQTLATLFSPFRPLRARVHIHTMTEAAIQDAHLFPLRLSTLGLHSHIRGIRRRSSIFRCIRCETEVFHFVGGHEISARNDGPSVRPLFLREGERGRKKGRERDKEQRGKERREKERRGKRKKGKRKGKRKKGEKKKRAAPLHPTNQIILAEHPALVIIDTSVSAQTA